MKISVIIPIYNVGHYLRETLDSVVNQTYQDIEIICINDGSTDDSGLIIEEYAAKDSRIKIVNQENKGLFVARQTGINIASSNYIIFLDGDDWLSIDTCEIINNAAQTSEADIIQFGVTIEGGKQKSPIVKGMEEWFNVDIRNIDNASEMMQLCYMERKIPWNIATKAIKTIVAKNAVANQEPFRINQMEDFLTCFYLFAYSKNWISIKNRLYHYRYGTGISTRRTLTIEDFEHNLDFFKGLQSLQRFADSQKLPKVFWSVAYNIMPHFGFEDFLHLAERLEEKDECTLWADKLSEAAGYKNTLHMMAQTLLKALYEKKQLENKSKRKKSKYRRLLWGMGIIIVILIIQLLYLI